MYVPFLANVGSMEYIPFESNVHVRFVPLLSVMFTLPSVTALPYPSVMIPYILCVSPT